MKKTTLIIALIAGLSATYQASAMNVNSSNMVPVVATNTDSVSNAFSQYGNPTSGLYFSAHVMTGDVLQKNNEYAGAYDYPVRLTAGENSTHGFGITAGYQHGNITNAIAKFLQVKRVSTGIEVDSTTGNIQGSATTAGNPEHYHADYQSSAILFTNKVNVFQLGRFSPYVELGLGYTNQSLDAYELTDNDTYNSVVLDDAKKSGFTHQIGAGIDVFVMSHMSASVGYRYVSSPSIALATQPVNNEPVLSQSPTFKTNQGQWLMSVTYSV
ncbi:MAG: hypothetical protein K5Q00_04455 [Gammaproteobacteria bacterium]|nr:hypothetical protein [Gammaproteobacteria bacterium]